MTFFNLISFSLCLTVSLSPLSAAKLSEPVIQSETPVGTLPETPQNKPSNEDDPSSEKQDLNGLNPNASRPVVESEGEEFISQESTAKQRAYEQQLNRFLTTGFVIINAILFFAGFTAVKADQGTKVSNEGS